MMNFPLTTSSILEYVENEYGDRELVSYNCDGVYRGTYGDMAKRVRKLANSLTKKGIRAGDRVATLAWNSHRHMELYYAISSLGAICHTINPRYSAEQITYIVEHAEDKALYFDKDFLPLADLINRTGLGVEHFTCLVDDVTGIDADFTINSYEAEISVESDEFIWPEIDENSGAALCYTSGTTGNPKGVMYTHRSISLHSLISAHNENLNIVSSDAICPIVPMFHVNAWGLPYTAPMFGASLIFAGSNTQPEKLFNILCEEKVTYIAGVPTILSALSRYMKESNSKAPQLKKMLVGGAAPGDALIKEYEVDLGINVLHGWGMTETSPVATLCTLKPKLQQQLSQDEQLALKSKQGRRPFGIQLKLVGPQGEKLPHDGEAFGDLMVKGAWVTEQYYGADSKATDADGWFATGDIATIDPEGYMQIVDRSKDVIKSGGEWISSVELENKAAAMPEVVQAAVIGVAHEKWDERPLLLIVPGSDCEISKESVKAFLKNEIPSWWMPDDVLFVDSLPIGATGKIQKKDLREQYQNHLIDNQS